MVPQFLSLRAKAEWAARWVLPVAAANTVAGHKQVVLPLIAAAHLVHPAMTVNCSTIQACPAAALTRAR
jgi:hypothetical protein